MQDGKHERGGLSRAGLGNTDHIVAFDHRRDDLFLNGGCVRVAFTGHSADKGFGEAELSKCLFQR